MLQRLQRIERWNSEKIDATPAQFRKMSPNDSAKSVRIAMFAGKKMAMQLAKAGNTVKNLDREQIERWRLAYRVPLNRVNVMLMVAWSALHYPKTLRIAKLAKMDSPTIGLALPRMVAKQMLAQYGATAERMVRSLMKQSADKTDWKKVLRIVRRRSKRCEMRFRFANETIVVPVPLPERNANLGKQVGGKYSGYLAKQQRSLRSIPKPVQTPVVIVPPKRLLSEEETYAPSMCISCEFKNHFHRNPVRFGGTVFCESCQPR